MILMWLGAAVGGLVALSLVASGFAHVELHGLAWWIAIGAVKLSLLGSAGLMAAGAAVRRLGRRQQERTALGLASQETRRLEDE